MESYRQSRLTLSLNYPRRRQPWGRGDRSLTELAPLRTQALNGQIDSACNGPVGSYSCEPKPNSQERIKEYKLHGKHSVVTSEYHSITQCCAQTSSHPYSADNLTAGADTESLWLALVKMILTEGGRNSLGDNVVHKLNASSVALPTHCHRSRRCRCLPVPWESHRLNTNRHTYHALTLLCIIASEATTRHCAKASGISCRPPAPMKALLQRNPPSKIFAMITRGTIAAGVAHASIHVAAIFPLPLFVSFCLIILLATNMGLHIKCTYIRGNNAIF